MRAQANGTGTMTLEIRWETCAHATFATRSERYQWQLAHTRPGPDPGGTRPGPACRDRQMAGGRDPSRERAAVSGGFFDTHTSPIAPEARDAVKRLFIARTEVTPAAGEKLRKKDFFPEFLLRRKKTPRVGCQTNPFCQTSFPKHVLMTAKGFIFGPQLSFLVTLFIFFDSGLSTCGRGRHPSAHSRLFDCHVSSILCSVHHTAPPRQDTRRGLVNKRFRPADAQFRSSRHWCSTSEWDGILTRKKPGGWNEDSQSHAHFCAFDVCTPPGHCRTADTVKPHEIWPERSQHRAEGARALSFLGTSSGPRTKLSIGLCSRLTRECDQKVQARHSADVVLRRAHPPRARYVRWPSPLHAGRVFLCEGRVLYR